MKLLLNLKNFFGKSKAVREARKSINRATAEEQLKLAISRNKIAHLFGGARDRDLRAIYIPHNTKQKGWMRELRRTDRSHKYRNRKNKIHHV